MDNIRKIVMVLMVVVITLGTVVPVKATQDLEVKIDVIKNIMEGNVYDFEIEYKVPEGKKGDRFEITLPFPVNVQGGEYLEVRDKGKGKYEMVFKDDFQNVRGSIQGKKTVYSLEELNPIEVDGKVIISEYPPIENQPEENPSLPSELVYKGGRENGDRINWFINLNATGEGMQGGKVTDEIGDGHRLIKDSFRYYLQGISEEATKEMGIITDLELSETEINFNLSDLQEGQQLVIMYDTEILNGSQKEFENQLIIEDETKVSEKVIIEGGSDIEGEKPEEPDKPSKLPQVGETLFKKEVILAIVLLLIARKVRKS